MGHLILPFGRITLSRQKFQISITKNPYPHSNFQIGTHIRDPISI